MSGTLHNQREPKEGRAQQRAGSTSGFKVTSAEFVRSAVKASDFLRDGRPELAFVGRSNVGKSSLINKLLGRKSLARTSSTPGRTRGVNYFLINQRFYVVDLPGYGWARASRSERQAWADFIEQYLAHEAPRVLVLLIDAKVGPTPLDQQAAEYLRGQESGLIVAVTKIDRVPRTKRMNRLARINEQLPCVGHVPVVAVSAKTGEGIAELRKELAASASL